MQITKLGEIISRAWEDQAFKMRLLSNPANALKEHGVEISEGVRFHFHENSNQEIHIVIPERPDEFDEPIDDAAMRLSGGGCRLPCRGDNSW